MKCIRSAGRNARAIVLLSSFVGAAGCSSELDDAGAKTEDTGEPGEVCLVENPVDTARFGARSEDGEVASVSQAVSGGSCGTFPVIPVYFHSLTTTVNGATVGGITVTQMSSVINRLNTAFMAFGNRSYRFVRANYEYTNNPSWYNMLVNPSSLPASAAERAAKQTLRRGGRTALNLYTGAFVNSQGNPVPGNATFPWNVDADPDRDGVQIHRDFITTPIVIHEIGHWLGLFHTFENGCQAPGDQVADTPPQVGGQLNCTQADSCAGDGPDAFHNFMNIVTNDPSCLTQFTSGQRSRISAQWQQFRCDLFDGMELDIDLIGGDLVNFDSPSMHACRDSCLANLNCRAFTWAPWNRCYLKDAVPNRTISAGLASGIVRSGLLENGYDRFGYDYEVTNRSETSCRDRCAASDLCQSYTHRASTGQCFLKSATPAPSGGNGSELRSRFFRDAGLEYSVDRLGGDMRTIFLSQPNPHACQQECSATPLCAAFTYLPPLPPGQPQALCYLKNTTPAPSFLSGAISGKVFN